MVRSSRRQRSAQGGHLPDPGGRCGLRLIHSAHHVNCSLVIDECGCDHSLRARRDDCVRKGSNHCRQGEARRNHSPLFQHEGV